MNHRGSTGAPHVTERLAPNPDGLARAAELLRGGRLVAFPTETVYGLGADATDGEAVAGIYAAKARPNFNPLIVHVADVESALAQGLFDMTATVLARAFWPGPLTLVVPISPDCAISDLARAGLDSVAVRVPAHPLAHELLTLVGRPVAAPSANRSGRVSATTAEHVLADLDGIDAVVDDGPTQVGIESTIVACLDPLPRLLRPGGIPRELIETTIGTELVRDGPDDDSPRAPGMLAAHYAPRAQVRLNVQRIQPGEAALLFGPTPPANLDDAMTALNLSESGDLVEAAANLFAHLHALDASGAATIAAAPVPGSGLGEAINDRLLRASAGHARN